MKCLEQTNPSTIREAIKSPAPAIGFIYQDSRLKATAIVSKAVTGLVLAFNVGKTMNKDQVAETVNLLLEDDKIRSFKPDDFVLCFKMMKKGVFGKNYDRIDCQTIFEGAYAYLEMRMSEAENMSNQQHKEHKEEKISAEERDRLINLLKETAKIEEDKTDYIKKEKKPIVKSERDVFIQSTFSEFFSIWREKPILFDTEGKEITGRFIEYNGKIVDSVEYAQIKVKEYDTNKRK